jgi:hypothetical protein
VIVMGSLTLTKVSTAPKYFPEKAEAMSLREPENWGTSKVIFAVPFSSRSTMPDHIDTGFTLYTLMGMSWRWRSSASARPPPMGLRGGTGTTSGRINA